uniref:PKcGMP_CC domain-containing protein n=1 Tax=Meloidogyne hapla TaxID=6305 RepID=A0A1I8BVA1_MELHA
MPMPTSIPESYILLALYKDENAKLQKIDSLEAEKRRMQTRLDELEANNTTTTTTNTAAATANENPVEANNSTTTTTNTAAATTNENPVEKAN